MINKDIDRETVAAVLNEYIKVSNEYSIGLAVKRMLRDKIPEHIIDKITPIIRENNSNTETSIIDLYLNESISFDTMVIQQIENAQNKVGKLMQQIMPIIVEAFDNGEIDIDEIEND